jgi:hypothetical protein
MSKKNSNVRILPLLGCIAAAIGIPAVGIAGLGEDAKPGGDAVEAASALAMADELAAYGNSRLDPLALIVAAKIKKENSLAEREGSVETQGAAEGIEQVAKPGTTPDELLARALELGGGRQDVLALVDDVRALSARGDIQGAGCYSEIADGGHTVTHVITYTPGSNWVSLSGDGDTDLDLYVFSGDGRLICEGVGYSDRERCSWNQRQTGSLRVSVQNLGSVWNRYRLCTN